MMSGNSDFFNPNPEPFTPDNPGMPGDSPQADETSPGPTTGPGTIDDAIQETLDAIRQDCSASMLEQIICRLCQRLVESRASALITKEALTRLNDHLKALKRATIGKKDWSSYLQIAQANAAVNAPVLADHTEAAVLRTFVRQVVPDAPVPEGSVVPPGWKLMPAGVFRAVQEMDVKIAPAPVVILARLRNDDTQTEYVRLAWFRERRWQQHVCVRSTIAVAHDITTLSDHGLPVTSLTAKALVAYLAAYEESNFRVLPAMQIRTRMGWVDEQLTGFLWGRELIGSGQLAPEHTDPSATVDPFAFPSLSAAPNDESDDAGQTPAEPACGTIYFQGADAGDEQIAAAYHACGTFAGWKAAIEPALACPVVRLNLLASLSAPLLAVLADEGARNYTVDTCGVTSTGKTTVLRIAASIWGSPREDSRASVLTSWSTTRVGAERRAGLVNGLPIIRDDTKLARRPEDVSQVIYDVTEGRSRDRGTVKGLDRTTTFSTVMLISGEARAVSFSGDGGTRARVLTSWCLPFGKADKETAALVTQLNLGMARHYGHAGPAFVRFLLDHRAAWEPWRARYQELRQYYSERAQGDSIAGRLSDAFALIELTGELAAQALEIPQLSESPIAPLWETLTAEAKEGDRAMEALRFVWDYACAHEAEFYGRSDGFGQHDGRPNQPLHGWLGQWSRQHTGRGAWRLIGYIPDRLKEILAKAGFEYDAVVSTWKDRDWLWIAPSDKSGKYCQVTIGQERPRVVAIKREAFQEAGCVHDPEPDERRELREAAVSFISAVQAHGSCHGSPEALAAAIQAIQAWLATLFGPRSEREQA